MPRLFTLAEAERLLPSIEKLLRESVESKRQYDRAEAALQAAIQRVMMMGGVLLDRDRIVTDRNERNQYGERLKTSLEAIQEAGCLVKDLDMGLVDFPTLFRGQEVYICWKLGEPRISFWHGVHEGFTGRKPIDQDFLDNHRGESAN